MGMLGRLSGLRAVAITLVLGLAPALALVAAPAGASFSYNVLTPAVTTGAGATGVAVSPTTGEIWVTNLGSFNGSTISAVDPSTLAVTSVNVGNASAPYDIAVSPDGTRVYVALVNTNQIAVVDAGTKAVITHVTVGSAPSGVVVDSTGTVYATNAGSNTVSVIDPSTNTVSSTIAVGSDPEGIAVGPDDRVYVANWNVGSAAGGSVSVISGGAVSSTIPVASPPPIGITVGADSSVYVARANDTLNSGNVSRIDTATSTVTPAASPTAGVYGIAVDSAGTIYAGGFNNNIVYVLGSDLSLVGEMQAGGFFIRDVALSLDETLVYAAINNLGQLARLQPVNVPDTLDIVEDPADASINECNRIAFRAAATGNPLPTVAWETSTDGGTSWGPLPATDTAGSFNDDGTLRASATVFADPARNGDLFRAVFTNVLGSFPTEPATLTVPPMTISPSSPAPDGTIPVGAHPAGIVSDPDGDLYVAEYVDGTVSTIEGAAVTDSVAVDERVEELAFAPDGETLYATRETLCHPNLFEIRNGVVTDEIDVPGMPAGVAVGPDGKVYVTSAYTETLEIIEDGSVVASLDVPNLPEGVAVHPNGDVYVVSFGVGGDSVVTIVHPDLSTDSLTVGAGGNGIAIAPDGTVYVSSAVTRGVAIIRNGVVVTTLTAGVWPSGIAVDPDTGVVYVANLFSDDVSVIYEDQVVDTFAIPGVDIDPGECGCSGGAESTGPDSVAVRPSDGHAYVTLAFADAVAKVQWTPPEPPTVPGPPRSVSATPTGSGTANVSFLPPLDDGGADITGYTVTCTASGKPARTATGVGSPLTITGLTNGTTYSCRVTATNSVGTGPPSGAATVKTGVPGSPGTVQGIPVRQSKAIVVRWSGAPTNGGTITRYAVACASTNGGVSKAALVKGTARTVSIRGLTLNRTYRCRVSATNTFGTSSATQMTTTVKL